jgi:hypothetical protein
MKQLGLLWVLMLLVMACSGNKKKTPQPEDLVPESHLVNYMYKVNGLQDTALADTVWKMIFKIDGIDKLVISRADCTAVFTVNPELISKDSLEREIIRRGGKVMK